MEPRDLQAGGGRRSRQEVRKRKILFYELYLRQELGLVAVQSLQSVQEKRRFSESQEAGDVGGGQGHHPTVLIQHLRADEVKGLPVTAATSWPTDHRLHFFHQLLLKQRSHQGQMCPPRCLPKANNTVTHTHAVHNDD